MNEERGGREREGGKEKEVGGEDQKVFHPRVSLITHQLVQQEFQSNRKKTKHSFTLPKKGKESCTPRNQD